MRQGEIKVGGMEQGGCRERGDTGEDTEVERGRTKMERGRRESQKKNYRGGKAASEGRGA